MSKTARTGICCGSDGLHRSLTEKGEYSFSNFTIESWAEGTFENDPDHMKGINFAVLELHYGSVLHGESLNITSNMVILHPGSTIDMQGGGYIAEKGLGGGKMVSYFKPNLCTLYQMTKF